MIEDSLDEPSSLESLDCLEILPLEDPKRSGVRGFEAVDLDFDFRSSEETILDGDFTEWLLTFGVVVAYSVFVVALSGGLRPVGERGLVFDGDLWLSFKLAGESGL